MLGGRKIRQLASLPLPVGRPRAVKRVRGAALVVQGDQGECGVLVSLDRQCEVDPIGHEVTPQPRPEALPRKAPCKCRWHSQARQTHSDIGRPAARHGHEPATPGTYIARAARAFAERSRRSRRQIDEAFADNQRPGNIARSPGAHRTTVATVDLACPWPPPSEGDGRSAGSRDAKRGTSRFGLPRAGRTLL